MEGGVEWVGRNEIVARVGLALRWGDSSFFLFFDYRKEPGSCS